VGTVGPSYRVLIWFIRLVVNTFFRRIEVVGRAHVPAEGAVIFAGNHPNALMDGFVVATMCGRRPVHFMANAKLWRYPLMSTFLDALGAVPVYPRQEHGVAASNEAAFARLFEVLEAGSCMGIFPEGISHTGSQLVRLKTGTARIALAVAARRKVRVTLVPCGLTYTHRHRFRSQALLHFGDPIVVDEKWLAPMRHRRSTRSTRSRTPLLERSRRSHSTHPTGRPSASSTPPGASTSRRRYI